MTVEVTADAVVGFVDVVAELVLVLEQVFVDQVSEGLVLVGGGDFGGFDLAGDVALFVGKEDELVTVAGDQAFLFQALQGFFNAPRVLFSLAWSMVRLTAVSRKPSTAR